jgi:PPM family protein phosphatase
MAWAARTDVGKVRKVNEDSLLVADGLFVVADGMGGHAAGDIASRLTVETFVERCSTGVLPISDLAGVIDLANTTVMDHASEHHREGMGSTLVGAVLADNGGSMELVVFHVGDSRCYVSESGVVRQVTRDHSEVQEMVDSGQITQEQAATHPHRNVVTRAIGIDPSVYADYVVLGAARRRRLLLCSDGVSGEVPDSEIERLLGDDTLTPDEVADHLMATVLAGRAPDNATLIVVDVEQPDWCDDDVDVTGPRARPPSDDTAPWPAPDVIADVPAPASGIASQPDTASELIDDVPT